jgi:hypothetical protein
MSTTTSFDNMLKKYMPYQLLREEMEKRDYLLGKIDKDMKWKNGELQVPFKGGSASSFAYGELTDVDDITENRYVLGIVSSYKEIWGSMIFNDRDLSQHGDMETSFIKILPDTIEDFVGDMKEIVSVAILNGSHIVTFSATATEAYDVTAGNPAGTSLAAGKAVVDRYARLSIGQYLEIGLEGAPADYTGYVKSIDVEFGLVEFAADKALTLAGPDFTAGAVLADADKGYVRGAISGAKSFTALPAQLLSLANGGTATQFGQTKLAYPHLQAHNTSGVGMTSANVLDRIFDAYNDTRLAGKGNPTEVLMSFKHLASCMKILEASRAYVTSDTKANKFGWTEIQVTGVKGSLKLVGIREQDDDNMVIIDWDSLKLHSNGMFERRVSPEGKSFFEVRSPAGFKYIVDTRFFGELVVSKPSHNGIIYKITNY